MKGKILFVDDDVLLLNIMEILIEKWGYKFFSSGTGEGGINKVEEVSPDIVILDIGLPDMLGFDVCDAIKKQPLNHNLPVVFVTGQYFSEEEQQKAFNLGADDFLIKPYDPNKLLSIIEALIKKYSEDIKHN